MSSSTKNSHPPLVLFFDGLCGVCNGFVRFILRRDVPGSIHFCPLQSPKARDLLGPDHHPSTIHDTVIVLEGDRVLARSDAVLRVLMELGPGWRLLSRTSVLPRRLRDAVYDAFARHRYSLFARSEDCILPAKEHADRFL